MTMSSAIAHSSEVTFEGATAWENLLRAWRKAARGKRGKPGVARFEYQVADRLLMLQSTLRSGTWKPGGYVHFYIQRRKSYSPRSTRRNTKKNNA
jgi:hypothetical protein